MTAATRLAPTRASDSGAWMRYGLCRQVDADLFFPEGRGAAVHIQTEQAKKVCNRCPVRQHCLNWALETGQHSGVWGGTSPDERRGMACIPESSMTRCLNAQQWIEEQQAAGTAQRAIARHLDVDVKVLARAISRFRDERAQGVEAVKTA